MRRVRSWQNRAGRLTLACMAVFMAAPQVLAQKVVLRIRPNIGDTLRMQLDQRFEMTPDPSAAGGESAKPFVASVSVGTRAVVVAVSEAGTDLESLTDSVTITPDIAAALPLFASIRKSVGAKSVSIRVSPDGAISVIGGANAPSAPEPLVAQMPPMLPREAVSVGDRWNRTLTVPISATHAATGSVNATFSFDSLSQDGNNAYISMRGSFSHLHPTGDTISSDSTSGTITGTMQIDRRLGWMVDSKATISLSSTTRPAAGAKPVRTHVKVSQWLRSVAR